MNTHEDFRNVIQEERNNLTRLSEYWNNQVKCNPSLPKDVQGLIRAAVGKTRLLLAEKFKQFEGLVEQSENNTSEKEISINDLQGFWDLVLIQVNEIKEMFRTLTASEKVSSEPRKSGKPRSPEVDHQKEVAKIKSVVPKKKLSGEYSDQTERRNRDLSEKSSKKSESGDLKAKVSLSKF